MLLTTQLHPSSDLKNKWCLVCYQRFLFASDEFNSHDDIEMMGVSSRSILHESISKIVIVYQDFCQSDVLSYLVTSETSFLLDVFCLIIKFSSSSDRFFGTI